MPRNLVLREGPGLSDLCGLTFELRRPRRQVGLAAWPMMDQGGWAAKPACRSGSPLERGVRPHLTPNAMCAGKT